VRPGHAFGLGGGQTGESVRFEHSVDAPAVPAVAYVRHTHSDRDATP
jgi:hypothetical protein